MTPLRVPYAIVVLLLLLTSAVADAQPDSVDYQMWVREARARALRGFTLKMTELRERNGTTDTAVTQIYRYTFAQSGSHIILAGNHAIGGTADSMSVELDTAGRKLMETIYDHGNLESIQRWQYDFAGRLTRMWYDFARGGWHPPEQYYYDVEGVLQRVELRGADGGLVGMHLFHRRDQTVIEYDTMYLNGKGELTSLQLTDFDSLRRAVRYQFRSFGVAHNSRQPYGFFNVYHDSLGSFRCDQYPLVFEQFANDPWRMIRYDSAKREEVRTVPDSVGASITDNRYLPDERFIASSVIEAASPLRDLSCDYTSRGMLERATIHDYPHSIATVLNFKYIYSAMGP
jgi:hypothetical protein